ncbi:mucin-4-like [Heterodontus francisci]|uniref:mucin-4-like n=1 Tax=Heterodontus francisci TaxID=7792 RepID=UPI00355C3A2E
MSRHIKEYFLMIAVILALSAQIKVNSAFTVPMTTEEEYVTDGPDPLPTTEEEYVTDGPDPLPTTEEEYVTDGPDPLPTTEEEYVTDGPDPLPTTEEEYVTDGPDPLPTTEEEYVTDGADPLPTTIKNVPNGTNPLLTPTKDSRRTLLIQGTKGREVFICLIIIGILIVLCTILLVSTIALASRVSSLKTSLKKLLTSNSGSAKLWSTGPSQLPDKAAETNVTLEEIKPLNGKEDATTLKDDREQATDRMKNE